MVRAQTREQLRVRFGLRDGLLPSAFGTDGECAKLDPNTLAKVLFRSGALFEQVKDKAKAKQAFGACAALQGVTDVVATSQQVEAKNRLKALK